MTRARPVWLYALTWNETRMLRYFFQHYDPWVDRYILYDDGSTDDTLNVLAAHPRVEVQQFERVQPNSFVESSRQWQNSVWKESCGHASWVVLTAIDEHLLHSDMPAYLARCARQGVTAVPALGFNMIAERFPDGDRPLADSCRSGMPHWDMCKLSLFDPSALEETNYSAGRHFAEPVGRVVYPQVDELLNLHFKYIDKDYLRQRHRLLRTGLGEHDLKLGLGRQYSWDDQQFEAEWQKVEQAAIDYRDPSVGFTTHVERWWRGPRRRS